MKITPKAGGKVLKLAVYDEDFVSDEFKCTKEIPEEELDNNSWWYLHGKLENIVGYDKAYTINCFSAGYSKETLNCLEWMGETVIQVGDPLTRQQMYVNGIIPIEIEGINEPCLGYFWTEDYNYSWIYKGKDQEQSRRTLQTIFFGKYQKKEGWKIIRRLSAKSKYCYGINQ